MEPKSPRTDQTLSAGASMHTDIVIFIISSSLAPTAYNTASEPQSRPRPLKAGPRLLAVSARIGSRVISSVYRQDWRNLGRAERDLLAHGALRAARWLMGKKPGRYLLDDLF